jgi:hypothetical protein
MVSGIHPVGITQNECFLSCDTVLLGVRCVSLSLTPFLFHHFESTLLLLLVQQPPCGPWPTHSRSF